ncbi:heavy metal translocating P-type ATPase [Helcococcus bovis]|uniref:heavy metal translocating P-type ATPase n=1 Tax=Helcococcus bovis TaxID=3153252 RepID=UPI0038BB46CA
MKRKFDIEGMTCASCQLTVEKAVKKLGIENVNVSLLTNTLEISNNDISDKEIIAAIENSGYKAFSRRNNKSEEKNINPKEKFDKELKNIKNRLKTSIPLMVILMYVAMGEMVNLPYPNILNGYEGAGIFAFLQLIFALPIIYVNRIYFQNGFKSLFKLHPNMDSLVAIGSFSAIIYGIFASFMIFYGLGQKDEKMVMMYHHDLYYEAATMILTLITFGKYLEIRSKSKTTDAINKLIELKPDKVKVVIGDKIIEKSVDEINIGDLIKVSPGERIAVDGILIEGKSNIDKSAITGESIPVEVDINDEILSGFVNMNGSFIMKTKNVGSETTISKIISLMEEASATKAPISKLADKISGIFVPIVILISVLSFVVWLLLGYDLTFALSVSIGVLVISCPCALGLATPVAMMVANGKAAEQGILVKNSEALEILSKINTIVFDKTGTITEGKPQITDIYFADGLDKQNILDIAYSLELNSEHPLSKPFNNLDAKKINVFNFKSISGNGIEAEIEQEKYFIGNKKLLLDTFKLNDEIKLLYENLSKQGKTVVFLFNEKNILAIFGIADVIKNSSVEAIDRIKNLGINTVMLTGDNKFVAEEIAKNVGINDVKSELLPQDKDKVVENYQLNQKVAMVGDGINDAPALMRADIGIAIADGTDIAIESADLVLTKSNLYDIVNAIKLSKRTLKIIKENLFWAFIYNVISIPLAMGVFYPSFGIKLNPMIAAFAMSMSSVFVVTNSLRLRNFKYEYREKNEKQDLSNYINYGRINLYTNYKDDKEYRMEERRLNIEGMSCGHCKKAVETALSRIAKDLEVSLEDKYAIVKVSKDVADDTLITAVEEAGYEVVSVE